MDFRSVMFEQDSALAHRACEKVEFFGLRDAWFYVPMLLSADTMNIFHQQARLISLSEQGSN